MVCLVYRRLEPDPKLRLGREAFKGDTVDGLVQVVQRDHGAVVLLGQLRKPRLPTGAH